jgi:hypothetical protein
MRIQLQLSLASKLKGNVWKILIKAPKGVGNIQNIDSENNQYGEFLQVVKLTPNHNRFLL